MKISFDKYIDKDGFTCLIIPTIAFGKDEGTWSIGFGWLCFIINIDL